MAVAMTAKYWFDVREIIEALIKPVNKTCVVYVFSDELDRVLYVGKTLNPLERFGRHCKDKEWFAEIAYWEIEYCADEIDALNREDELIKELQPIYNKTKNRRNRPCSQKTKRYWKNVTTQDVIRQVKQEMGMSSLDSYTSLPITQLQQFVKRRDELLDLRQVVLMQQGHL